MGQSKYNQWAYIQWEKGCALYRRAILCTFEEYLEEFGRRIRRQLTRPFLLLSKESKAQDHL